MDKPQGKNDLNASVAKFCLAVEEFRRNAEGRVRTSQEFLAHFFSHDEKGSNDQLFVHLPMEVRGPILSGWGIRGLKAALRDTDAKVESVVFDALVAGDIDHGAFEQGLTPDTIVRWVPLTSWWSFWRGGKLSKKALHKALETAFNLGLFDAKWFLDTLEGRGGKLRGTDVIAEGLTKADLTDWVTRIHQSADGTPKGIVLAIGWEKIVAQTANEILVAVLDALATKVSLVGSMATSDGRRLTDRPTGDPDPPKAAQKGADAKSPAKSDNTPNTPPDNTPPDKTPARASTKRPPVDNDGPELQVGEVEASLTDEGMIVDVEDERVVATATAGAPNITKVSALAVPASDDEDEDVRRRPRSSAANTHAGRTAEGITLGGRYALDGVLGVGGMGTVYADVVIAKGMHRDVDARYATTHQFQQALEHLRDRHAAPRGRD